MAYKDKFQATDYPEGVVDATKKLARFLWKKDLTKEIKARHVNKWIETVCCAYEIEPPIFIFSMNKEMYQATGGGCYMPDVNTFFIFDRFSLTTIMHEFRHFMQHKSLEMNAQTVTQKEEDARGWSVSLFFIAKPEAYAAAVEAGSLHFE